MAMKSRALSVRISNQIQIFWKLALSYRKRDWELPDYPVEFRTQETQPTPEGSRFKSHPFVASILNWRLTGTGDSPADALDDLSNSFRKAKSHRSAIGKALPRPGSEVPIEFASRQRIDANAELAEDFIQRVLELPGAWISDESSLWDFHSDETNDAYYSKIKEVYGVDVSDIQSANLSAILERIAAAQKPA
jgi:hypothetical protein